MSHFSHRATTGGRRQQHMESRNGPNGAPSQRHSRAITDQRTNGGPPQARGAGNRKPLSPSRVRHPLPAAASPNHCLPHQAHVTSPHPTHTTPSRQGKAPQRKQRGKQPPAPRGRKSNRESEREASRPAKGADGARAARRPRRPIRAGAPPARHRLLPAPAPQPGPHRLPAAHPHGPPPPRAPLPVPAPRRAAVTVAPRGHPLRPRRDRRLLPRRLLPLLAGARPPRPRRARVTAGRLVPVPASASSCCCRPDRR
jgi:hypothetical protein